MAIKLVLSDIDGTLLLRGNAAVDRRVTEAFHALLDADLAVGPASGRALPAILPAFAGDEACVATALATNGMQVYAAGGLIHEEYLDHEGLLQLAAAVREVPRAGMICFKGAEVFLVEGGARCPRSYFPLVCSSCNVRGCCARFPRGQGKRFRRCGRSRYTGAYGAPRSIGAAPGPQHSHGRVHECGAGGVQQGDGHRHHLPRTGHLA